GGNVKVTFLLYIHKMRNQRASPERGGARRAEGLTMKSNIFLFLLPVNSNLNSSFFSARRKNYIRQHESKTSERREI
ncbi:MAG: hypothetical protein J6O04_07060, partial [Selenomonadaceae bacterium]|nr:hypothetical protein [Selenomonadaceae bacterium]